MSSLCVTLTQRGYGNPFIVMRITVACLCLQFDSTQALIHAACGSVQHYKSTEWEFVFLFHQDSLWQTRPRYGDGDKSMSNRLWPRLWLGLLWICRFENPFLILTGLSFQIKISCVLLFINRFWMALSAGPREQILAYEKYLKRTQKLKIQN